MLNARLHRIRKRLVRVRVRVRVSRGRGDKRCLLATATRTHTSQGEFAPLPGKLPFRQWSSQGERRDHCRKPAGSGATMLIGHEPTAIFTPRVAGSAGKKVSCMPNRKKCGRFQAKITAPPFHCRPPPPIFSFLLAPSLFFIWKALVFIERCVGERCPPHCVSEEAKAAAEVRAR